MATVHLAHGGHVVPALSLDVAALRSGVLVLTAAVAGWLLLQGLAGGGRRLGTAIGLGLVVLVAIAGSADSSGVFKAAALTHSVAACLWLGAVALIVTAPKGERTQRTKQLKPAGVAGAALIVISGIVQANQDRVGLDGFAFDRIVLTKAALLTAACVLAFTKAKQLQLALLLSAAVLGGLLAAVPGPPPKGPLATRAGTTPVTVIPQRVGENLVHVDTDQPVRVNGIQTQAEPGTTGQWARVSLPKGRSTVTVGTDQVLVDTTDGKPNPDGPECAETLLAQQLAKKPLTACPSQSLTDADAKALQGLQRWLTQRGVTHLEVRGDSSPRSVAARQRVQEGGAGKDGALLLTGTWESAARELAKLDRTSVPRDGVYLAPWLLTGPLLQTYATAAPLVALPFDPHSAEARRFFSALPLGEAATGSGFAAFGDPATSVQVWATTPASIFPTDLGHGHASTRGWFPGGALAPVSRTLII